MNTVFKRYGQLMFAAGVVTALGIRQLTNGNVISGSLCVGVGALALVGNDKLTSAVVL